MKPGDILLVDTNVIIEAFRVGCFAALASSFRLETVEECLAETQAGNAVRAKYVPIDEATLRAKMARIHPVTEEEQAQLIASCPRAFDLDRGERALYAHALQRQDCWIIANADRAAVLIGFDLGWTDRFYSLEELANRAGRRDLGLKKHHCRAWLAQVKTESSLR